MGVLTGLMRDVAERWSGRRVSTPDEVRRLLDQRLIDGAADALERLPAAFPRREVVWPCLAGEVAFRRREDERAERLFRDALAREAGLPDGHYGLSLVMLARGDLDLALRHAQFAVNLGDSARFSAQLGLCQLTLGNHVRAKEALMRATRLDPHDKASWNNLGIARRALGQLAAARTAFVRALEIDAGFGDAINNLQVLEADAAAVHPSFREAAAADIEEASAPDPLVAELRSLGNEGFVDEAIDRGEALCADLSDRADLAIELARLYRERGDTQSGLDALRAFIARRPDDIDAIGALGCMLVENQEFKPAAPLVEQALASNPDDLELLHALAEIRTAQGRFNDAGQLIERAYAVRPCLDMKGRLAASLCVRCRYEECLALIDEMLAERPSVAPDVMGIRVDALTALGRHEEVLPALDDLIADNPNEPNRRYLRSTIHLLRESFAEGWDDYAYRNLQSTRHLRMLPFPLWKGEPLAGRSILVAVEQGVGDQIMFASCIGDLERLGPSRIVLEVSERVAKTIERSFPTCEVVASRQDNKLRWLRDIDPVDCFVMLGDLPRYFRRRREDFPRHAGYLRVDQERREHWSAALEACGQKPRIGLSWRGGTELTRTGLRSIDVTNLAPLTEAIDATWVCLQYGDVLDDLARAREAGLAMTHWPEAIADLDEFAGLVSALDLVVTVCNTTVHYAGALGVPVWVLAPKVPEWRYGFATSSMPWYPSSLMVRQRQAGDWSGALQQVASGLAAWAGVPSAVGR